MLVQPHCFERTKTCSKECQNKQKLGKRNSPATEFKKGNRPQTWVPVGSETITKGYMRVKVAEPNVWRQRSHIAWEKASGESLPEGWIVRHLDRDSLNDDPKNLKAMPRSQHIVETLKDPQIEKRKREGVSKAGKRRWKKYREEQREKKLKQYDTYYWETS